MVTRRVPWCDVDRVGRWWEWSRSSCDEVAAPSAVIVWERVIARSVRSPPPPEVAVAEVPVNDGTERL